MPFVDGVSAALLAAGSVGNGGDLRRGRWYFRLCFVSRRAAVRHTNTSYSCTLVGSLLSVCHRLRLHLRH